MKSLSFVLAFKIFVTFLFWWLPLAFFPASLITSLGFPLQSSYMFIRLLGMAYFSLGVGYVFGLQESLNNQLPVAVIWTGIISNGGTCALLAFFGIKGAWLTWGTFAQFAMWTSLILTGIITIGLIITGVWRS
jgi:hypothetical protein